MERSGVPLPGIQAQRPRTRTARTTRQINGAIVVGGQAVLGEMSGVPAPRVQRPIGFISGVCIVLLPKVELMESSRLGETMFC